MAFPVGISISTKIHLTDNLDDNGNDPLKKTSSVFQQIQGYTTIYNKQSNNLTEYTTTTGNSMAFVMGI